MNISQHNDNIQITITRTKLMNMGLPSHIHAVCFQSPIVYNCVLQPKVERFHCYKKQSLYRLKMSIPAPP